MTVIVFSTRFGIASSLVPSLTLGTSLAMTEGLSVATPEKANSKSEILNNIK